MANNDSFAFPRIPEKNWWTLRDQFNKSLPKEVSVGYLKSLLQLQTESAAKNVIRPLQTLGLIDEEMKPTDLANDWRNDNNYAHACAQMLEIYPQELRDLYNTPDVDLNTLANWFQYNAKVGERTAQQAASLYHILLEAEPKDSSEFNKPKTPKKSNSSKKKVAKAVDTKPNPLPEVVSPAPSISPASSNDMKDWFSLHIDLQIHISPEADAEQIDNIFASMAKHIMSMRQGQNNSEES